MTILQESDEPIDILGNLNAAFEEAVLLRIHQIEIAAKYDGALPLKPMNSTPLMVAVNSEAHIRYFRQASDSIKGGDSHRPGAAVEEIRASTDALATAL